MGVIKLLVADELGWGELGRFLGLFFPAWNWKKLEGARIKFKKKKDEGYNNNKKKLNARGRVL